MTKTRLGKKATKAKAAHMSIKYPLLVIYFLSIISCRSINYHHIKMYKDTFPVISFCDLPNHKGKQVYVKGYYSGILEYWTFNNGGKGCDPKLSTDLQFEGSNPFNPPQKFETVFNEAFNNYQTSF